jgi:hypothetical protein
MVRLMLLRYCSKHYGYTITIKFHTQTYYADNGCYYA